MRPSLARRMKRTIFSLIDAAHYFGALTTTDRINRLVLAVAGWHDGVDPQAFDAKGIQAVGCLFDGDLPQKDLTDGVCYCLALRIGHGFMSPACGAETDAFARGPVTPKRRHRTVSISSASRRRAPALAWRPRSRRQAPDRTERTFGRACLPTRPSPAPWVWHPMKGRLAGWRDLRARW